MIDLIEHYRMNDAQEVRLLRAAALSFAKEATEKNEVKLYAAALGYTRFHDRKLIPRHRNTSSYRAEIINRLREQGLTWKKIGEAFELSASRAQQIASKTYAHSSEADNVTGAKHTSATDRVEDVRTQ